MTELRVLLADDQDLVRTGLVTVIDSQPDMSVIADVGDGAELVRRAAELRPDVVVTDVRMPVMDGIEATRLLAGPEVVAPIPVLVLTTFDLDEYVVGALRVGASGFLLKDARPTELVAAIRTVAAGDALVSPSVTRRLIGAFGERLRADDAGDPASSRDARVGSLSPRETEVLSLVASGLSNAEIAERLVLSRETVKTFVSRILTKLSLRDRVQAVIYAYRVGLVSPED